MHHTTRAMLCEAEEEVRGISAKYTQYTIINTLEFKQHPVIQIFHITTTKKSLVLL